MRYERRIISAGVSSKSRPEEIAKLLPCVFPLLHKLLVNPSTVQMARYKKTGFMDEDSGSVSSIQLNEGVRSGGTHIRYHTVS
ncbi:unnamed protein product [Colias eurytheme]|nr:unnamed protein product [Colias eurytheme]